MKNSFLTFACVTNLCIMASQLMAQQRPVDDSIKVYLSASGDIQTAISTKDNSNGESVGNGSLGMSVADDKFFEVASSITVASIGDTVKEGYGSSLLITNKGSASAEFNINYFPFALHGGSKLWDKILRRLGIYFFATLSNAVWKYEGDTTVVIKALNSARGIGAMITLKGEFNTGDDKKEFRISINAGYAYRDLLGDIRQDGKEALRMKMLNTEKTTFVGWEYGLSLSIDNLSLDAKYVRLGKGDGAEVSGLTHGQLLTKIAFRTRFNVGKLFK